MKIIEKTWIFLEYMKLIIIKVTHVKHSIIHNILSVLQTFWSAFASEMTLTKHEGLCMVGE